MGRIHLSVTLGASLLLAGAGAGIASAQSGRTQPAPARAPQPVSDQVFVAQAAMVNMAEIQLGHLAVDKAQYESVKDFGEFMVEDHVKAQNELLAAAMGAGVQWPKALDAKHAALKARLSSLKGDAFDREYIKAMIDGHHEVEQMLVARAADKSVAGPNAELHAKVAEWAAKTLPAVREHMMKAEQVSAEIVKATK
jgi:putative membrane protein